MQKLSMDMNSTHLALKIVNTKSTIQSQQYKVKCMEFIL